jgi:hypothetical protein
LHALFIERYPEWSDLTEQRTADKCRVIKRNRLVPDLIANNIMEEVEREIQNQQTVEGVQQQTQQEEQQVELIERNLQIEENSEQQIQQEEQQAGQPDPNISIYNEEQRDAEVPNIRNEVVEQFSKAVAEYYYQNAMYRPKIPKLKINTTTTKRIMSQLNSIIENRMNQTTQLQDVYALVYCAAVVAVRLHKQDVIIPKDTTDSQEKPSWQIRLEKRIAEVRSEIRQLTQYRRGNKTKKVVRKIRNTYEKIGTYEGDEDRENKIVEYLDKQEQTLSVLRTRLSSYVKSNKRK